VKLIKKITRHTLNFFIIPLAILLVVIIGSASALFYFYPQDKVLAIVTSTAEKTLKRKVTAGGIHYSLGGIRLSDVIVLNSMNPADSVLIKTGSLRLRFNLLSLIRNKFEITHIQINNMDLTLSYKDSTWNLQSLLNDIRSAPKSERRKKKGDGGGISTTLETIGFDTASITLESSPDIIKPLIGKYLFNGVIDISSPDEIIVRKFAVTLPEQRGEIESQSVKVAPLSADAAVTGDVQLNSASLGWLYHWGHLNFLPYNEATVKINSLSVTSKELSGNVIGTTRLRNRTAVNVSGRFKAAFKPVTVNLFDVTAQTGSSSAHLKSLTAGPGIPPSFSSDYFKGKIEEIGPAIPFFPSGLTGGIEGNIVSERLSFTGRLGVQDLSYGNGKKIISGLNGTIDVKGNCFRAENIPAKIMSSDAVISVAAPENLMKEIALNLRIGTLDLTPSKDESGDLSSTPAANDKQQIKNQIPALPIRIRGSVDIAKLKKNSYELKGIEASYEFAGNKVSIPRYRFLFLDASVMGSGSIDLSGKTPLVETAASIDDFKVQNIGTLNKEMEGRVFGNAKARLAVSFRPADANPAETIQGKCDFAVTNGKLVNTGIQNALGIWLDSLKYKLKDLEFNTISGSVLLERGNLDIRTLIFNSPDIRVMVDGEVLHKNDLNAKLSLEFTSTFIQDIPNPALIRLNMYKKGKWYTIPISAKGDISKSKYDVNEIK
jgi:hypothetical protein